MPGAKIVHRDLDALFVQPVKLRQRTLFFHHAALGDFKHQRKVIARQLRQQFIHVLVERRRAQVGGGDVEPDLASPRQRFGELRRIFGDQPEQVAGERHDQPVAFGVGDKDVGRDAAFDRMLPADQRFQPADAVAVGMEHRLVFDKELVALDAAQQRAFRALPQQQHVIAEYADHQ